MQGKAVRVFLSWHAVVPRVAVLEMGRSLLLAENVIWTTLRKIGDGVG